MEEIGVLLKETRESSGVNIEEASRDLNVNELSLTNIEDGKIGAFKDVFELKQILHDYAKYSGLDETKLVDQFNEYLFEYTSKIPVKEIEKTIELQLKEESSEEKVISPYTKKVIKVDKKYYILAFGLIILLVALAMVWAIRQVSIGVETTNIISYMG